LTVTTTIRVPQTDPRASYLEYKAEIDAAISTVLEGGRYVLGPEVEAFEKEFARFIGGDYAIAVGNGTDALVLAIQACGIGAGDVVFTVSHTAVATVAAIEIAGATPLLVDIEADTYTMSARSLENAIGALQNGRPRAVIPVHLYGHPADLTAISAVARKHNLVMIEDCAQSHGATLDGRRTGSWGTASTFSFYPTKNLGAIGDGGMIVTSNSEVAERARLLRQYGWKERYLSEIAGTNSRLDELQAAILRVKLRHLAADNQRRRAIAERYSASLGDTAIRLPRERSGASHVYHQFVVRHHDRDALREHLAADGIGTLIHYALPVHLQPAYRDRLTGGKSLPETERAAGEILSLPMFPQLTNEQVDAVSASVRTFVRE
jgi:dTDP-4-amino-4,6-dideoxygalactose transaminase